MQKTHSLVIVPIVIVWLLFMAKGVRAFEFEDTLAIDAAYMTHLSLHEMGHQVVAGEVGADHQMSFFTSQNGRFYPGLSTAQNIPEESRLSYALGGYRMEGHTFEYALQSYHHKPTTYNKALMVFSCADFLGYTLLANYIRPEDDSYDPNVIRAEIGLSKTALLSMVMAKSLLDTYRVFNKNANFTPFIWVDKYSAALLFSFSF
jgi:hypothetical protein